MQTRFSLDQLADPHIQEVNQVLRTCVHCGFCLATCPTYLVLGNELDSPRGRIYLAKEMLEADRPASPTVVKHLDRCLTCLSCTTTCPSGVQYQRLLDRARSHVEKTYTRPVGDRLLRRLLATVVPNPRMFRLALTLGRFGRPLKGLMPGRLKGLLAMAPPRIKPRSSVDRPQVFPAEGPRRRRVALFTGCAQRVLEPEINGATVRILTRHGCEVVVADGAGCCGAIVHHMGDEQGSQRAARANIGAWQREISDGGLDAVVFNASGCGVSLKDYGHLLKDDPVWAGPAARIASLCRDVTEVLIDLGLSPSTRPTGQRVAYHLACSMQHGLGLRTEAKQLLVAAGFEVLEPSESHICCGSAGAYSILQPTLANTLRERKLKNLDALAPHVIAAGNIGCISHLAQAATVPVVHTVELLDWATGGPTPTALAAMPSAC